MIPSNPIVAFVVMVGLFWVTSPIAKRLAAQEGDRRLIRIVMWSVALHLIAAPVQIYFVDHYYHGITDYNRYVNQGAILGPRFDRFNFSLSGTNQKFLGAGSVSVFTGVVFALVGVNKAAAFFVFGWFAFIGTVSFYRAFANTFPGVSHRRYALLIFFLPSLIFWTAGVSKESVMYLSIGVAADGASRILARKPRGVMLMTLGTAIGVYVRPQELLIFLGAVAAATLFRSQSRTTTFRALRFIGLALAEGVLLVVVVVITQKLAKQGAPVFSLTTVAQNNSGASSSIPYHPGPTGFFNDVYHVLFDPEIFNAHSASQRVAALENTVIVVLILTSWRRILRLPRAALARPYLMAAFLDLMACCYAFAAFANLGLIDRERVLALPFLLVLISVPITPKGQPPQLEWELSRRQRGGRGRLDWSYTPPGLGRG